MAADIGGVFAEYLESAPSPRRLFTRFVHALTAAGGPRLVVFEDAHWADQATVDLLRFLGRRVERLPTAIVVTFRDDEVLPSSAPAVLLGDLATAPGVSRLVLPPLSREATRQLLVGSAADPDRVFERTGGNPFFINAVAAAGGAEVPATVRDAVLARLARLSADTRAALEAAAVIGPRPDPTVLAAVLDRMGVPRWTIRDASCAPSSNGTASSGRSCAAPSPTHGPASWRPSRTSLPHDGRDHRDREAGRHCPVSRRFSLLRDSRCEAQDPPRSDSRDQSDLVGRGRRWVDAEVLVRQLLGK
jgi:hypothetical protein